MATITSTHDSKSGDGKSRTTINYSDGSSRDITYTDHGIIVDDHDSKGNTTTGDGVSFLGKVRRINSK